MNKMHRPHRQSGYIAKVDFEQTTDQRRPARLDHVLPARPEGQGRIPGIHQTRRPDRARDRAAGAGTRRDRRSRSELERELIQRGVSPNAAAELVRQHAEEKIRAQIERLDWLAAKKPEKIDEPAAYLVAAIKNDYAAPKGFVSKAERQRREEAKPGQGTAGRRGTPPPAAGRGGRQSTAETDRRLLGIADARPAGRAPGRRRRPGRS